MYNVDSLVDELSQSENVSQKAIDIASILLLLTSFGYSDDDFFTDTVQLGSIGKIVDFSVGDVESGLRVQEVTIPKNSYVLEDQRVLVVSYFSSQYQRTVVLTIVFSKGDIMLPCSYLDCVSLEVAKKKGIIKCPKVVTEFSTDVFAPDLLLKDGTVLSNRHYCSTVSAWDLASTLQVMSYKQGDFYVIDKFLSLVEESYTHRI